MKVALQKDYRSFYTLDDMDIAKRIIAEEKEDEETATGWAEYAVNEYLRDSDEYLREIIKADARTARNGRIWDAYFDGSGSMDVWIECLAKTSEGYIELGAYLSDIWLTGSTPYKNKMYVEHYTKAGA